jgi:hypothetical protein
LVGGILTACTSWAVLGFIAWRVCVQFAQVGFNAWRVCVQFAQVSDETQIG